MKKDIHHIHDKTYRSFFENKEIFLQLLKSFVNEAWTTKLQEDKLFEDKSHYILRDFEEAEADIVYKATIEDEEVFFCILLELQSTVDHSMPIRLFYYMAEIWRKYLKEHPKEAIKRSDFKLPAIVPIVLYNGSHTWTAPLSFKNKVQRAELFEDHIIDFNYILINVNAYSKEDLIKLQNTISAIFLLDQKIDSNEFLNRAGIIGNEFHLISNAHKLKLTDWLDHVMNDPTRQTAIDLIKNPEKDVNKMTANITITLMEEKERAITEGRTQGLAEGRTEGRIEGRIEGRTEGRTEAKLEIAKKLLANGMPIEQVMEITELNLETLKGLLP